MRIVAVGEPVDSGLLVKLIRVIPGNAGGVLNHHNNETGGSSLVSPTTTASAPATPAPTMILEPKHTGSAKSLP